MSGSGRIDARNAVRDDVDRVLERWRKPGQHYDRRRRMSV
jgi:hypothetical protein